MRRKVKKESFLINIRKLTALDIIFHGSKFILAEFVFCVLFFLILGAVKMYQAVGAHPLSAQAVLLACALLWVGLNYVPLLLYSIVLVRQKEIRQEVAFELANKNKYGLKYTLQGAVLLVIPLAVPLLAISQEMSLRAYRSR